MGRDNPRVGVVGAGYWGSKHLRVLQAMLGSDRVAVIDERLNSMPAYAGAVRAGRGFTTLEQALPYVDAVVVATPPTTHVAVAVQAISAGKHVLVEKPMATTTAGAQTLIELADEMGVTLMAGHTFEYNAAVWMLRELIAGHELGDLYYLDSARLNLGLYQNDVNVVMDLAPHDISIANHLLGATPTSVDAWGSRHVNPSFEDVAHLRLNYDEIGVCANVQVSWLSPQKVRRTTAVGSTKMAVYDDMDTDERIRLHDKAVRHSPDAAKVTDYHVGGITSPFIQFDEPLAVQDRHFVSCVEDGSTPWTDGRNGLAVVQTLECAQLALAEGRRVHLAELHAEPARIAASSGADPVRAGAAASDGNGTSNGNGHGNDGASNGNGNGANHGGNGHAQVHELRST